MKKIILLISMLTLLLGGTHAQEQDNSLGLHLDFKGVALDGTLSSFMKKLQEKGFIKEKDLGNDAAIMKGEFANESVTLYILASQDSKTVWKVCAEFPKTASWSSLKMKYFDFKELYTKKYGEPQSYEFFSKPYYEGDGYEQLALSKEKCTYSSYFKTKEGYISVEINKYSCIEISYEDAINNELRKKEKEKNILNDI
ncbi:hypothetical protein [Bacteroides thetaiotaomicron]|jgi:hypothetical protein|uniref:Uncharacterized protein n=1 Tax=Bacteroides thetaiotaomicron TaxID=818 RepID=A0A174UQV5_BACT4|nr:hypothetical protein [Bacteroides thetaiotaomicron]CUQ22437.1 Uncharacterised protein [Bacteroides thetaiotaomicron]